MGCFSSKRRKRPIQPVPVLGSPLHVTHQSFLRTRFSVITEEYVLLEVLGSGAFTEVRKCFHRALNQFRAVKCIEKRRPLRSPDVPSPFIEMEILRSLDHPSILRSYEFFEDERNCYLVTDLCEGGELFTRLLQLKRFSEREAVTIMKQVLSAVAHCHSKGIVHRDLKPENILFEATDSLRVKLVDFGTSCYLDKSRKLSACYGSVYYVAPEVLTGSYNEKCDVWSCGVVLYMLLTGCPPYTGRTEEEILSQVKAAPLKLTSERMAGVSNEAWQFLNSLLNVDHRARVSAKLALLHPWLSQRKATKTEHNLGDALSSLRGFKYQGRLKEAVKVFIASQLIDQEECRGLKDAFLGLDTNNDGRISKGELLSYYENGFVPREALSIVEKILGQVDSDNNEYLEYSEFIALCLHENTHYKAEVLQHAFNRFDLDRSGDITAEEVKSVLQGDKSNREELWQGIIAEMDQNGDGKVDLPEFLSIMEHESK